MTWKRSTRSVRRQREVEIGCFKRRTTSGDPGCFEKEHPPGIPILGALARGFKGPLFEAQAKKAPNNISGDETPGSKP